MKSVHTYGYSIGWQVAGRRWPAVGIQQPAVSRGQRFANRDLRTADFGSRNTCFGAAICRQLLAASRRPWFAICGLRPADCGPPESAYPISILKGICERMTAHFFTDPFIIFGSGRGKDSRQAASPRTGDFLQKVPPCPAPLSPRFGQRWARPPYTCSLFSRYDASSVSSYRCQYISLSISFSPI